MPPIFVNDKVVFDFKEKANLFNSHFAKQCSILENNSELPNQIIPSMLSFSSINLNEQRLLSLF